MYSAKFVKSSLQNTDEDNITAARCIVFRRFHAQMYNATVETFL